MIDLKKAWRELGIGEDLLQACTMPPCEECTDLVDAGPDMFDRPQLMTPGTLRAWCKMQEAALGDGIELKLVSAHRSVEYQCNLLQQKLADGRSIEEILSVNAIPGYSEHHTGRALDLHAGDGPPLELDFEDTLAFKWLCSHAGRFGFHLSYPRGNPAGIVYEPWHWCFDGRP